MVLPPIGAADYLFPAANGQVLARAEDKVSLFDMSQKRVVGECSATKVKYVVWSEDMSRVALLSKHSVFVLAETRRRKAGEQGTYHCLKRKPTKNHGKVFSGNQGSHGKSWQ